MHLKETEVTFRDPGALPGVPRGHRYTPVLRTSPPRERLRLRTGCGPWTQVQVVMWLLSGGRADASLSRVLGRDSLLGATIAPDQLGSLHL